MHNQTPSISAIEPRGLSVRAVAYCRRAVDEPVEARVTQQVYDAAGRLVQQRDPRLFALAQVEAAVPANLVSVLSLSGQPLGSDSVDAGWQRSLPGAAGQAWQSWDQRGWQRRTEHDSQLRAVALFEHFAEDTERCAERITWGSSAPDDALHNRCGQPVRQDDPAGCRLIPEYGISAVVLAEVRQFLASLEPPDWPVAEAERDRLLEAGEASRSAWQFTATGEALSQTDAKGHSRHFLHDRAGQLHEIRLQRAGRAATETLVSGIEYSASGQVKQELTGNGIRTFSRYDPADGHLLTLTNQTPDGGFLQNLSYRYDPVGNITDIVDAALPIQHFANQRVEPVRRFAYDTLYQLISANGWETAKPSFGPALPQWQPFGPPDASRWRTYSETYYYDAAGNLLQRMHLGAENDTLVMQVATQSNRSIKHRPGADVDELFDARGNLRELQPGQGLTWNGRNQLAQVTQVARTQAADDLERYVYDGEGTRLRKWRSAAAKTITHTTEVRYLPGIELHTNSATGEQFHVSSVQAGRCSVRLLHWDSPPPDGVENDQLRFCFNDHLGSSAIEVDAQARAISQEVFYPFGGTAWRAGRNEVESRYKTIRYSCKERDATGLYYYGARYYMPWLQRWLNPDPAGDVDGLNFYGFVRNNPSGYVDHCGHYGVWAKLNDFMSEQHLDNNVSVTQRGMKNIRRNQPVLADAITDAFDRAKSILADVTAELDSGSLDIDLVKNYFGTDAPDDLEHLSRGYEGMLRLIEKFEQKPQKLTLFSEVRNEDTAAMFVLLSDRRKKIYINSRVVASSSLENNAHSVIHELTHLSSVFKSEDLWYLKVPTIVSYDTNRMDELRYVSMKVRSTRLMDGEGVVEAGVHVLEDYFTLAADAGSLREANEKFKKDPALRTHLAINNADTLAAFAKGASRSRQNRLLSSRSP